MSVTVQSEVGADTLSANSQTGWGLFSQLKQDILQLREESMNEPENESAGSDTQALQPQIYTHTHRVTHSSWFVSCSTASSLKPSTITQSSSLVALRWFMESYDGHKKCLLITRG